MDFRVQNSRVKSTLLLAKLPLGAAGPKKCVDGGGGGGSMVNFSIL